MNTALFALLGSVSAFPAGTPEETQDKILDAIEKRVDVPGFNAKEQLVSVSGAHRYIPANFAAGDQRGPCPGLNALANHGEYLMAEP